MFIDKFQDKDDSVRVEQTQKKQVEYTLVGTQRRVPWHRMYSYNKDTKEIKEARIIFCDTIDFLTMRPVRNPRLYVEKGCIYMQALNKKNFIKRLKREGFFPFPK